MNINLMWFRRDLRIHDNKALYYACQDTHARVIAIFVYTPGQWLLHNQSPKQTLYIYKNLIFLKKKLLKLKIPLFFLKSTDFLDSVKKILNFCCIHKVKNLYYNYEYGCNEKTRDNSVQRLCIKNNIVVHGFYDNVLISPEKIKNHLNQAYKRYQCFKKKIINTVNLHRIICYPKPKPRIFFFQNLKTEIPIFTCPQEKFNESIFLVGEDNVFLQLEKFCNKYYKQHLYKSKSRNYQINSFLSSALNIGVISVRKCVLMFLKKNIFIKTLEDINANAWINEILWREFFYHLMYSYPELSQYKTLSLIDKRIPWKKNKFLFTLWKNGNTGYPIIDAAMRQLNELGWISNRLRMISGSFLAKIFFLNWRLGERYFMSRLVDGNLAINNGCWQWVASVGTEKMPYFRKFNFLTQSKKIDPLGVLIRKMIPELRYTPNKHVHFPYLQKCHNRFAVNFLHHIDQFYNKTIKIFSQIYSDIKHE
ncbi:FAD-binding domain-containing protein [Buchnera aphidicola]|uniref:FAD-binding domain-containing protein n=1 Tax=Buchnera aphidicola TaxID=9 RepID=UPI00094DCB15|nr:FAD-binding domain-containing protein [Buchnera aphidicola]